MLPDESVERGLEALKAGVSRHDDAHLAALWVAELDLLDGQKPSRQALSAWAAERLDELAG
jgi:hypothetical protein